MQGQTDSLIIKTDLSPVVFTADKMPLPGQNLYQTPNKDLRRSLQASSTLAELLTLQTTAIVRDRGNNSLATLSIRGGSSSQTQVLWNGANVNNGMLGLSDLSTISPLLMEDVQLHPVQNDESYQPIGGALTLSNTPIDSPLLRVGVQAGQYGFRQYHAQFSRSWNSHTEIRLKGLYAQNQQDFPYLDEHRSVLLPNRQPHAFQSQWSGMIELAQSLSENHKLELRSWWHAGERELPPSLQQRRSTAIQSDSFQRHQLVWKYDGSRYQHLFNYTYRKETNHFEDPLNAQDSQNPFQAHQWISQHRYMPHAHVQLKVGANVQHLLLTTENYANREEITEGEVFLGFDAFSPTSQHRAEVQIRQGWRGERTAPLTGQIAWEYFRPRHRIRLEYSRAYRFPSANDLFWTPFGNPDLKPEHSHQLQWQYTYNKEGLLWDQIRFASYYKQVKDWILWAPLNTVFFRPHNILQVTSTGFETSISKTKVWTLQSSTSIRALYNYQYVRNTGPYDSPVAQKGENLIYMPEHQWSLQLSSQWRRFSVMFQQVYQSKVFTQANLQDHLPARMLSHLTLSYSTRIRKQDIQCFLRIQNLWSESYFFQPHVPAPGRLWRWGIIYKPKF
jgi:iron complex outermembrane receptor protein